MGAGSGIARQLQLVAENILLPTDSRVPIVSADRRCPAWSRRTRVVAPRWIALEVALVRKGVGRERPLEVDCGDRRVGGRVLAIGEGRGVAPVPAPDTGGDAVRVLAFHRERGGPFDRLRGLDACRHV